ncbi:MAG: ATPase, T2SS/T4P/T4SS family [Desulfobacterales bacterium]|nr:ATPase, T2SS/T4P/T4SS family [Desulfobacterales bacterium]MDX2508170.1 ATPase, T2SS/T4P/T4SS family [Desulfobacterales bacterium]
MRAKKKLGEILVEGGLITEKQLQSALPEQKKAKLKLGQFFVQQGILTETQIVRVVSSQLQLEEYSAIKYALDTELANIIPADMAYKYQVAPLNKIGLLLTVAMLDPMDINSIDAIEVYTNSEIEAVICTEQDLNQLHSGLYGSYSGIGGVLEDMEEMQYDKETDKTENTEDVEVSSLQGMAEEAPVIRLVNSILSQGVREGASDLHISPERNYVQVRFRVDGKLHEVPAPPKSMFLPIISRLKILANMDISISRIPQDGRFTVKMKNKEINIRTSTMPSIYGENMVLRLLDTSGGILSLERLGMSEDDRKKIEKMIQKPYGMILSTGPTGSGKSTSLYSILKNINKPDINIITVEDPVEYRIEKIRQIQLNRKAGMTFADGLRSILRQDPDVIMVGEIRDAETATIAVQAALTGHRVFSTLHTNDAAGAITRFVDMGVEPFLVSSVMTASFAQRLVRTICPQCKKPFKPPQEVLEFWGLDGSENTNFMKGKGCFNCLNTGYKGRTGIYEVLIIDDMIQKMILKNSSSQEITRAAIQAGSLTTLKENAAEKVRQGITTFEEASSAVLV